MDKRAPLKIVVVGGSGFIGQRHCHHIISNPKTLLFAIVDPSPTALEDARSYGTDLYPSISALLASGRLPDAAIVCTPNHTHVRLSIELVHAGIHILCEKPISNSIDDAKSLVTAARRHNVHLLVGHHRRFNPYVVKAKEIINSGVLGHISAINGLWATPKPAAYFSGETNKWRSSRTDGGGVVLLNMIHEIDLMHHFLGPVQRIHAERMISRRCQEMEAVEEGAAIILRFESGVLGTFILSDNVASPHSFEQGTGENPMLPMSGADVYRFMGTEGTLSVPDMMLSTYAEGDVSWKKEMSTTRVEVRNSHVAPFDSQLDHFVAVCRGQQTPSCTGEEGLRALVVCEAIRTALYSSEGGGSVLIDMTLLR